MTIVTHAREADRIGDGEARPERGPLDLTPVRLFRDAMASFPSGVTTVTTADTSGRPRRWRVADVEVVGDCRSTTH